MQRNSASGMPSSEGSYRSQTVVSAAEYGPIGSSSPTMTTAQGSVVSGSVSPATAKRIGRVRRAGECEDSRAASNHVSLSAAVDQLGSHQETIVRLALRLRMIRPYDVRLKSAEPSLSPHQLEELGQQLERALQRANSGAYEEEGIDIEEPRLPAGVWTVDVASLTSEWPSGAVGRRRRPKSECSSPQIDPPPRQGRGGTA